MRKRKLRDGDLALVDGIVHEIAFVGRSCFELACTSIAVLKTLHEAPKEPVNCVLCLALRAKEVG